MRSYIGIATIWHKENNPYDVSSYEYSVVAENEERAKEMITDRINTYKQAKLVVKVEEVPINEGEQLREVVSASYKGAIVEHALKKALAFEAENEEKIREESSGCVSTDLKSLLFNPGLFYSFVKSEFKRTSKVIISDGKIRVYDFGGSTIDEETKATIERLDLVRKKRRLKRELVRTEQELGVYL